MESIGLLTPPAQRMSMSWSTFWRRPEEKKLEPLLWLSLATESLWVSGLRMSSGCLLQRRFGCTGRAMTGAAPRRPARAPRTGRAPASPPRVRNWLRVEQRL